MHSDLLNRIEQHWRLNLSITRNRVSANTTALNAPSKFIRSPYYYARLTLSCFRYFETDAALQSHWRSKIHKRRCKLLKEPPYSIEESERSAGLGREQKRERTTTLISEATTESLA